MGLYDDELCGSKIRKSGYLPGFVAKTRASRRALGRGRREAWLYLVDRMEGNLSDYIRERSS